VHVTCANCGFHMDLSAVAAGSLVRCGSCGRSFVLPRDVSLTGQQHRMTPFSVAGLLLLHYVTFGVFTLVYPPSRCAGAGAGCRSP